LLPLLGSIAIDLKSLTRDALACANMFEKSRVFTRITRESPVAHHSTGYLPDLSNTTVRNGAIPVELVKKKMRSNELLLVSHSRPNPIVEPRYKRFAAVSMAPHWYWPAPIDRDVINVVVKVPSIGLLDFGMYKIEPKQPKYAVVLVKKMV
jgi:hypothetical protein